MGEHAHSGGITFTSNFFRDFTAVFTFRKTKPLKRIKRSNSLAILLITRSSPGRHYIFEYFETHASPLRMVR